MMLLRHLRSGIMALTFLSFLGLTLTLYYHPNLLSHVYKHIKKKSQQFGISMNYSGNNTSEIMVKTFDLVEYEQEVWGQRAMTDFIIGKNQTENFRQKSNDSFISEVQPRSFQYIINNETLCKSSTHLEFLLIVYSAPKNFKERNTVRQSWGQIDIFSK